jgi:hypothetical protein
MLDLVLGQVLLPRHIRLSILLLVAGRAVAVLFMVQVAAVAVGIRYLEPLALPREQLRLLLLALAAQVERQAAVTGVVG